MPEGRDGGKQVRITSKTPGRLHWKAFLHAVSKKIVYDIYNFLLSLG